MAEVMNLGKKRKRKKAGLFSSQSIMKYIRLGALVIPAAGVVMQHGVNAGSLNAILEKYTGYNAVSGSFSLAKAAEGWMPYATSVAITYGIPKLAGMIRGL